MGPLAKGARDPGVQEGAALIARILGWLFVFLALMALGAEILLTVQQGGYDALSLSDLWRQVHTKSYLDLEHMFMGTPMAWFWDPVMLTVLACPAWVLSGLVAAMFFLRRERRKRKGVVL